MIIDKIKYIKPNLSIAYAYMRAYFNTKAIGAKFVRPNYAFFENFQQGDVAIDVGIGDDPDFSKYLIYNYKMESFGVDPTRKHSCGLQCIEKAIPEFHYLPYALGTEDGRITFFEPAIYDSGSVLESHLNMIRDSYTSYPVEMVTLGTLLQIVNKEHIAIMKIDIEGYEFELIDHLDGETLKPISQLIIEFHHGTVKRYTFKDTIQAIKKIEGFGMKSLLFNGRDCLFYW